MLHTKKRIRRGDQTDKYIGNAPLVPNKLEK